MFRTVGSSLDETKRRNDSMTTTSCDSCDFWEMLGRGPPDGKLNLNTKTTKITRSVAIFARAVEVRSGWQLDLPLEPLTLLPWAFFKECFFCTFDRLLGGKLEGLRMWSSFLKGCKHFLVFTRVLEWRGCYMLFLYDLFEVDASTPKSFDMLLWFIHRGKQPF